jgi:uncharacterized protein YciI
MLYAILGEDAPGSLEKRREARQAHLERLEQLKNEGRLVLAGPFPAIDASEPGPAGFTGSLIVAEFLSLEDAESWIAGDPYVTRGIFARVAVKPFRQVLP